MKKSFLYFFFCFTVAPENGNTKNGDTAAPLPLLVIRFPFVALGLASFPSVFFFPLSGR